MTTRTRATVGKLRVRWHNPPNVAPARVTLERVVRGKREEREIGPRDRLTLTEAAAVLQRPVREVRADIRTKFLRALPGGRHVTLAACQRFLAEERADGEAARAALEDMRRTGAEPIPSDQVFRELGLE